ncbi:MAG: acyltransferase [Clostridia bacterium]|nr:acyltransferase [Clostridia bacterium]
MKQKEISLNNPISGLSKRSLELDFLKALAIVSVIFYHIGFQQFGYLGVDIFFVINGFLVVGSILKNIEESRFSYVKFLFDRLLRLWPIVLIATAVCMLIGFWCMLPDDYENLAQSAIASNFFATNVLSCITTKDYWNVANEFKPLMHTWYLGILVQSYFIIPIIPIISKKVKINCRLFCGIAFSVLALISLVLYLSPAFSDSEKFYYLPFRFFEIALGAIIACFIDRIKSKNKAILYVGQLIILFVIISILFVPAISLSASFKLLTVCFGTALLVLLFNVTNCGNTIYSRIISIPAEIGKCSFSIFIWHQVIIAFIRYTLKTDFSITDILIYLFVVAVISFVSYRFIEKPLSAIKKSKSKKIIVTVLCILCCIITSFGALYVYLNAGVVRDVPELDISKDNVHRNMHAEYCDRGYSYDNDFTTTDKVKVLVIGDSFGRDWINILLESEISDKLEISYIYPYNEDYVLSKSARLDEADLIFRASSNSSNLENSQSIEKWYDQGKVYVIGNKRFGECNGIIYNKRNTADYFSQSIKLDDEFIQINEKLKSAYGDHFIDMITPVMNEDGTIRVFSSDNRFISQDCLHLTKAGAQYYASILDLSWIPEK